MNLFENLQLFNESSKNLLVDVFTKLLKSNTQEDVSEQSVEQMYNNSRINFNRTFDKLILELVSMNEFNENKYLYHGTKSEESFNDILSHGFDVNLNEICLTDSVYDAQGYGKYIVVINKDEFLKQLKIGTDKTNNYDGYEYNGTYKNYIITNIYKLNNLKRESLFDKLMDMKS